MRKERSMKGLIAESYRTIYCFVCFVLLIYACEKDEISVYELPELELEVHSLVNNYRMSIGLDTLAWDNRIMEICRGHSANMAKQKVDVGHDGFNDRFNIIQNDLDAWSASENVAAGYRTAQSVVDGWLDSRGHRDNIEGDYDKTGVGIVADDNDKYYFTQIFYK